MLVALALYTSTAHAGIPPHSAERRASVRIPTSLTEDQQALPKHSQRLPEVRYAKKGHIVYVTIDNAARAVWKKP